MQKKLVKIYCISLTPLVVGLLIYSAHYFLSPKPYIFTLDKSQTWIMGFVLLIDAAFTGVAFPILYRSLFASKHRDSKHVPMDKFMSFQKAIIIMAMNAPVAAFLVLLFGIDGIHLYATSLIAFYAVYYHYPTEKKIHGDMKIFRVKEHETVL